MFFQNDEESVETIKAQMMAPELTRDEFKKLCLLSVNHAKIGIDIDAKRSRYLLLKGDLQDLAELDRSVALHLLNNNQLRASERLDRNFSSFLCRKYPDIMITLFSSLSHRLPNQSDIVDIMRENTELFSTLLEQPRFITLIDSSVLLNELSTINESIAESIYQSRSKFRKLDMHSFIPTAGFHHEKMALAFLNNKNLASYLHDETLMLLGKQHVKAAEIILSTREFTAKIPDERLDILQEKIVAALTDENQIRP